MHLQVFFFGLAAKEVTEACLPGGSLNPPRKALAPLIGTVAGVAGPIAVYFGLCALFWSIGAFDGMESLEAYSARQWLEEHDGGAHRRLAGGGSGSSSGSSSSNYSAFNFSAPEAFVSFGEITNGWGIPTATDISLAWMVAVQVAACIHMHAHMGISLAHGWWPCRWLHDVPAHPSTSYTWAYT